MNRIEKHFDAIADRYDHFKERNWYYYENLKKLYAQLIPKQSVVLEIGCGTGDLISGLDARQAIGIDISSEMIKIAKQKHPQIRFESVKIENFSDSAKFEYIFLADVIEHLEDVSETLEVIGKICDDKTKVIFSYANVLWEPVLVLLEKMSLKMPEGPHYRIPYHKLKILLQEQKFEVLERSWRLIFPAYIPYFSEFLNNFFYKIPILRRLGMLEYIIIKKK